MFLREQWLFRQLTQGQRSVPSWPAGGGPSPLEPGLLPEDTVQQELGARLGAPGETESPSRLSAGGKGLWDQRRQASGKREKLAWEGASAFFRPR